MTDAIETYLQRQATTVGIKLEEVRRSLWVPQLSGANGNCLGVIETGSEIGNISIFPDGRRLVTTHEDTYVRCWDLTQGTQIWKTKASDKTWVYGNAISPDGKRIATSSYESSIHIFNANTGNCVLKMKGHSDDVNSVTWSPNGEQLASISADNTIRVWDVNTGICINLLSLNQDVGAVHQISWSPNGRYLASVGNPPVHIWDARSGKLVLQYEEAGGGKNCVCWSPDSYYLASGLENGNIGIWKALTGVLFKQIEGNNAFEVKQDIKHLAWSSDGNFVSSTATYQGKVKIWDVRTTKQLAKFENTVTGVSVSLAWSSDSSFVASNCGTEINLWNTRHLLSSQTITTFDPNPTQPLLSHLSLLPTALAQLHRLGIYPPLSLVQNLLDLTGGHPVNNSLTQLTQEPGISELIALRWSEPARIGLIALLLHKIPFPDWEPSDDISPREISNALQTALKGEPTEAKAPPPPISLLQEAAKLINEQLLFLLQIIGEQAVITEPALPLRLLARIPNLPALSSLQRQLLGVRVSFGDRKGRSIGNAPGAERGQVSGVEASTRTDWTSLLPSQLALPQKVLNYRYQRGELLFRTRELAEPPRMRPTVLLLDISPPAFGSIETITRISAFTVANFLRKANIPVVLITNGEEQEQILQLDNPEYLVEIWAKRSISPINEVRSLKLANAIRTNLKDESGLEPIILLLTHPWFGAEAKLSPIPGLRGLFVQYPSVQVQPTIAKLCDRYLCIDVKQTAELGETLGYLLG
ncbi:MAG: WD40 repeat domain-containing protein [Cyanobacteria bacterium P01_A01_bin.80]